MHLLKDSGVPLNILNDPSDVTINSHFSLAGNGYLYTDTGVPGLNYPGRESGPSGFSHSEATWPSYRNRPRSEWPRPSGCWVSPDGVVAAVESAGDSRPHPRLNGRMGQPAAMKTPVSGSLPATQKLRNG